MCPFTRRPSLGNRSSDTLRILAVHLTRRTDPMTLRLLHATTQNYPSSTSITSKPSFAPILSLFCPKSLCVPQHGKRLPALRRMHGGLRSFSYRILSRGGAVDLKCSPHSGFKMMRMAFDAMSSKSSSNDVTNPPSISQRFGPISGGGISEDRRITFGYSSFQGKRATMEDFYDAKISKVDDQMVGLFGVFDGHGGSRAAEYLKKHLFDNLIKHPQFASDTKLALTETYQQTDSEFLKEESNIYRDDGSTASTAVLVGDRLFVANVGDSRAVILRAGEAVPLSKDHKPNRIDERQRIEQAGGNVMWAGTWRVGGVLAVSRAFGNRLLKRFVVAEPEIEEQIIKDDVDCLVIASDGLWDVVSNEDAVSLVKSIEDPEAAARKLTETAFNKGSADNITCVVVRFNHDKADLP